MFGMFFGKQHTYTSCPEKSIPNIVDCHLKKGYRILIIFGTFVSIATGHQMTI